MKNVRRRSRINGILSKTMNKSFTKVLEEKTYYSYYYLKDTIEKESRSCLFDSWYELLRGIIAHRFFNVYCKSFSGDVRLLIVEVISYLQKAISYTIKYYNQRSSTDTSSHALTAAKINMTADTIKMILYIIEHVLIYLVDFKPEDRYLNGVKKSIIFAEKLVICKLVEYNVEYDKLNLLLSKEKPGDSVTITIRNIRKLISNHAHNIYNLLLASCLLDKIDIRYMLKLYKQIYYLSGSNRKYSKSYINNEMINDVIYNMYSQILKRIGNIEGKCEVDVW